MRKLSFRRLFAWSHTRLYQPCHCVAVSIPLVFCLSNVFEKLGLYSGTERGHSRGHLPQMPFRWLFPRAGVWEKMLAIMEEYQVYSLQNWCGNLMSFFLFYIEIHVTRTDYLFLYFLLFQDKLSKKFNASCDKCEGLAFIPAVWKWRLQDVCMTDLLPLVIFHTASDRVWWKMINLMILREWFKSVKRLAK